MKLKFSFLLTPEDMLPGVKMYNGGLQYLKLENCPYKEGETVYYTNKYRRIMHKDNTNPHTILKLVQTEDAKPHVVAYMTDQITGDNSIVDCSWLTSKLFKKL